MGRLANRKVLRRGISEAVVILILIVVAVAIGALIYGWTSTQMAKTPTTEMATAEWSATYGGNMWIVTVRIKNNLDRAIFLNTTEVTLNDGTYVSISFPASGQPTPTAPQGISVAVKTPTTVPVTIGPKSDTIVIFTVSTPSSNPPKTIIVTVTDSTTKATSKVSAIGGIQY